MSGVGHIMGVHIETDMRRDAFDHLLQLDHTYYNNTKVGQIMGRITNDLFDVTEFAHHCPEEFFIAGIKIAASFVILCQSNIPLTLVVFACVPLMGVVSVKLNHKLRERFRQQRFQIGELNDAAIFIPAMKNSSGQWWANSVTSNRSLVMRPMMVPTLVLL